MQAQGSNRFSRGAARALCYILGPISVPLILHLRRHSVFWAARFHAFHATLLGASWGAGWGVLRLIEHVAPSWFLSTIFRELRFILNLSFLIIWACLLVTAYTGTRNAVIPILHDFAGRLTRKSRHLPLGQKAR